MTIADKLIEAVNVEYAKATEAKSILIKADTELEYGEVREVMDALADFNMTSIKIAANKDK